MPRPLNPDLTRHWKISLPATLAGTVEFYLFDPLHKKPLYGSRAKLITGLLEKWVSDMQAVQKTVAPPLSPGESNETTETVCARN